MGHWELSDKQLRTVILCFCMSFLCSFDITILISVLSTLKDEFECDFMMAMWVTAIMPISAIMFSLITIDISDKFGKRNCTIYGLAIIAVMSVIPFVFNSIIALIASRLITGLGIALILTPNYSMISDNVKKEYLPEILALNYSLACIGGALGPFIGLTVSNLIGWNVMLALMAPICIVFMIALKDIDNVIVDPEKTIRLFPHFLFILSFGLYVNTSFLSWDYAILHFVAVALFVILILDQWKAENRIIDISIFSNKLFTISAITGMLFMFTVYCIDDTVVNNLQNMDREAVIFGILISLPLLSSILRGIKPLLQCIISPLFARLNRGEDPKKLTIIGFMIVCMAPVLFILNRVVPNVEIRLILIVMIYIILAIACSVFCPQNRSIIMSSVETNQRNTASSVLSIVENIGRSFGVVITMYILAWAEKSDEATLSFSSGIAVTLALIACFVGIYLVMRRKNEFA